MSSVGKSGGGTLVLAQGKIPEHAVLAKAVLYMLRKKPLIKMCTCGARHEEHVNEL